MKDEDIKTGNTIQIADNKPDMSGKQRWSKPIIIPHEGAVAILKKRNQTEPHRFRLYERDNSE